MYEVIPTNRFQKEVRLLKKRGYSIDLLTKVIKCLAAGQPLPERNRDHALAGNWVGYRECHILPDWLLIYKKEQNILVLTLSRTGTHSDLDL
ncbi:MAG: type II toxin-antitoxin system YafQ family toxin [Kiritimatiellaeota bacterium]|nr:type II toxin-antitoxin system YafQ family toxin [Kiritimatiellota bacterium]